MLEPRASFSRPPQMKVIILYAPCEFCTSENGWVYTLVTFVLESEKANIYVCMMYFGDCITANGSFLVAIASAEKGFNYPLTLILSYTCAHYTFIFYFWKYQIRRVPCCDCAVTCILLVLAFLHEMFEHWSAFTAILTSVVALLSLQSVQMLSQIFQNRLPLPGKVSSMIAQLTWKQPSYRNSNRMESCTLNQDQCRMFSLVEAHKVLGFLWPACSLVGVPM